MTEFELGDEAEFTDLTLVNEDGFRGETKGAAIEPLRGRVRVGGPRGFKMTSAQVAEDQELLELIGPGSGEFDFYKVRLGISFVTHDGPRLESAQVKMTLTAVPERPAPFALRVRPSAEGTEIAVERTGTAKPKLSVLNVADVEIGSFEEHQAFHRTKLYVRGLGLEGSAPGWEFTRTPGQDLEGTCRLELVVQAGRGAAITVSGVVTAQATRGGLPWHYRAELSEPLRFTEPI